MATRITKGGSYEYNDKAPSKKDSDYTIDVTKGSESVRQNVTALRGYDSPDPVKKNVSRKYFSDKASAGAKVGKQLSSYSKNPLKK